MMKVHYSVSGDQVTLQVCGRLADAWVDELKKCWNAARDSRPGMHVSVDLRDVTFIDQGGESLLRLMHSAGASLRAAGLRNQEVVNQITGGSRS
jgi:hypothetical protein